MLNVVETNICQIRLNVNRLATVFCEINYMIIICVTDYA